MDITPVSSTTGAETPAANDETATTEEMTDFLRLLTAQIQNQDPLEPLDANQFIEQLATINSLEQQIQTNEKLESIIDLLRADNDV
ncbi:MAG: hypothetical protein HRU11_12290 [Parvularculaceae bacterium]|nr:hypothetical protein [Parvularculaceae bacterium]